MVRKTPQHVLFLCTGNSARSIMAEAVLNALGGGRFRGFSAGSHPKGRVHPIALEVLARAGYSTSGLRSKDWTEFTGPDAPRVDFVITLCDSAAREACPAFPGKFVRAHWGLPDPAAVEGSEEAELRAFLEALSTLRRRIQRFTSLPFASVARDALVPELRAIGEA
ncbi:MAG TPA: arsenate reductase ArsC [Usitatibacter sp.]|nr:arsenate reductase ArsC [Usitatibacter sp.]